MHRSTNRRLAAYVFVLLPLIALGTSCPESDPLDSSTGTLTIRFNPRNAAGTRFESVVIALQEIKFRPTDPTADNSLGSNALGAFTLPLNVDLTAGSSQVMPINVKGGEYRVVGLTIQTFRLFDNDPSYVPGSGQDCLEGVIDPGPDGMFDGVDDTSTLPDSRFSATGVRTMEPAVFSDDLVNIAPGGGTLTVNVDVARLVSAFEAGFTCQQPSVTDLCPAAGGLEIPSQTCLRLQGSRIRFDDGAVEDAMESPPDDTVFTFD